MVEILQNKNAATRFQVMVEIAASGQVVQQKDIAARLGVTPQAISEYIQQLFQDNLVISAGRSRYKVSPSGVNWMLSVLRDIHDYTSFVEKTVTNITTCAAIAEGDIRKGQAVGLKMKDGLLFAASQPAGSARGIAQSDAEEGGDVDIADIKGLVELTRGTVTILQVPDIQKGGSKQVDLKSLKKYLAGAGEVGAIGIEALTSLRRLETEPRYLYGVTEAAIEAAKCGLSFTVVCASDAVPQLMKRLQREELNYNLIDARLRRKARNNPSPP